VLDRLGRLPKPGEVVDFEEWEVEVVETGDRSVERVRVRPRRP
jgi:CBS domain containing-hemolysin-like protein